MCQADRRPIVLNSCFVYFVFLYSLYILISPNLTIPSPHTHPPFSIEKGKTPWVPAFPGTSRDSRTKNIRSY